MNIGMPRPCRRVNAISLQLQETNLELDSHADTCCIGNGALVLYDYDLPVQVQGYDPSLGAQTFRTISAALGYTCPKTGRTYHLVINQAIEIPHMNHHLLCPMQCRVNDIMIDETPKFLAKTPTPETHAIVAHDPEGEPEKPFILPLSLKGVTSYLPVHRPTIREWDSGLYPRIDLTSETLTWDPASTLYQEQEETLTDHRGELIVHDRHDTPMTISAITSFAQPYADISEAHNLVSALERQVKVCSVESLTRPGAIASTRSKAVDARTLAMRWQIPIDRAKRTVKRTTQRGVRHVSHPSLTRRFPTNDRMLRYNRLPHSIFTDTLIAGTRTSRGNKYSQIFATSYGWSRSFGLRAKSEAHESLSLLFKRDGVPPEMIMDGSKEQTQGIFKRKLREADCHQRQIEPYSPWMNAAEACIRELKRGSTRKMIRTGSPKCLWDDSLELESAIRSNTCLDQFALEGMTPEEKLKGCTSDISNLCEFEWYDWVMFKDSPSTFPDENFQLGRWLGPAADVGSAMTYKILKSNGEFVCRSTLRHLTPVELDSEVHQEQRQLFDASIEERLGRAATRHDFDPEDLTPDNDYYEDDVDVIPDAPTETLDPTPDFNDNYVGAELMLPRGGTLARGRVIGRKRDHEGNVTGRHNSNPIRDTREYRVEFDDGDVTELTANVIAENMYAQCDNDGHQILLLDSIIDYERQDNAMSISDQKFVDSRGKPQRKRSTKGWKLCVLWKDGSTTWEKLSDFKECYPTETAEYAVAAGISNEPAFNYWVTPTLKRRDRIISLVRKRATRYLKKTSKFGIELPKTMKEACELDERNGNRYWQDAIAKELKNVKIAFDILDDNDRIPNDYQFVKCHMIFDVKIEDFRRKARLVAGGHMTDTPKCMTYSSVVSRDTVRLALTLASLNDLEVKAGDVMNAYVQAPVTEKVWTTLGDEWGPDITGKKAIIVRAIYGLKSSGAAFRAHLADCMGHLGYSPCKADNDLWMKAKVDPKNEHPYYSYILCYVDDVLIVDHDAMAVIRRIDKYFKLKPESIGDPDMYLGAKLRQHQAENGMWCWTLSPAKYVQEAVRNCVKHLKDKLNGKYTMPKGPANPFPMKYEAEIDISPECDEDEANYFQSIIGVLRWTVEIGRVDISTEVSILSSYLAYPRVGHLEAAIHIMGYLSAKYNSRIFFNPTYPLINHDTFNDGAEWKAFYGDIEEAIPPDVPEARGHCIDIRMMVDSDHAGDKETRRSRTGFMIFVNMALIIWHSKKQPTVESSVFGAEFVAMKHGIEELRGLRYKLRMMGVLVDRPTYVYGDNMSVIHNTQRPESTLKKKSNSVCYHAVRESVAMKEVLTSHISTNHNYADLLTKVLYGQKRRNCVEGIMYDLYDKHPQ